MLCAIGLCLGTHGWLAQSTLLPFATRENTDYLFVSAGLEAWLLSALFGWGVVLAAHLHLRRVSTKIAEPPLFSSKDVAYLFPLTLFGVNALALLTLVPSLDRLLPVWLYAVVDLRLVWVTLLLAWVLLRADRRFSATPFSWCAGAAVRSRIRAWVPPATLVLIAVPWVVLSTPHIRFSSATTGDEPRYIRYCELLYQGLGFEMSSLQPLAQLPDDFRPQVWNNVALMASVLPGEVRGLAADVSHFLTDPTQQFNRATRRAAVFQRSIKNFDPGYSGI